MNRHALAASKSSDGGIFGENTLNVCKKPRAKYPFVLRATLHLKHCLARAEVSIFNCPLWMKRLSGSHPKLRRVSTIWALAPRTLDCLGTNSSSFPPWRAPWIANLPPMFFLLKFITLINSYNSLLQNW